MARRNDPEENFERFTRRIRKPRGGRSVNRLTLTPQEKARYDEPLAFKDPGLEELHELLAWGVLSLVGLHVLAAIVESRHYGENLVASMLHGRKRALAPGDGEAPVPPSPADLPTALPLTPPGAG